MTRRRPDRLLALLLAVVDRLARLVPGPRRREWRRQWRADLTYAWQEPGRTPIDAVQYGTGALRHAFWLRGHIRRMEMISHDLRYGWRLMVRRPAFTAVAILTLGLGIGANVTIYSWIDGLLLHPFTHVAQPDRLVALNGTTKSRRDLSTSYPDFVDMRRWRPGSVDDLIAYRITALNVRTTGDPERAWGELVSGNFFDVLGVKPALGRAFLPEDDRVPDAAPVVVLSDRYWRTRFDADPSIVGRTITINARAFTVIGVAPPGFRGNVAFLAFDAWIPMMMQSTVYPGDRLEQRNTDWLQVMVRLGPDVSLARAQADFDVVAKRLTSAYPDAFAHGIRLTPVWRAPGTAGAVMLPVLSVLMGVVGIVLLIACANVASLLLARASGRQRETAVRVALGASRTRVVQQLLVESALLAAGGGAIGVATAYWTSGLLGVFIPPARLPIAVDVSIGAPVLGFALVVTAASIVVFGLVPAVQGSNAVLATALKEGAGTLTAGPKRARLRQALVIAQVALSLVLLVSAGLFLQTLRHAQALDVGFSLRKGLVASLDLLPAGYDAAKGTAVLRDLQTQVAQAPGVEAATLTQVFPLGFSGGSDFGVGIEGYTPARNEEVSVAYDRVGAGYLRTMGIRLIAGRDITARDTAQTPDVGIVNETMAKRYWSGRSPIGGHIKAGRRMIEVVGVAADGKYGSLTEAPRNYLYLPVLQWYRPDTVLVVKTAGEPLAALPAVQRAVRQIDPNLPLFDIQTIEDQLDLSLFIQRMAASLLGGFGVLALLLATIGLYGVIAAAVAQRTPEIGMRMALGATHGDIVRLVLGQGLTVIALGVVIGLGGAFAATRLFASQLVGVRATDFASFAATSALLVAVAVTATYLPARRAAGIDPLRALRQE